MSAPCILLVGGGTGGHVFPMIAVADALQKMSPDVSLVFAGTSKGLEARVVPARGYTLELIEASALRGGGFNGALRGVGSLFVGVRQARALLRKYQPNVVFSLGGYVAGGVSLAARLAGIPLALMEPNSIAGLANRMIAPFAQRAYVAFEETEKYFSKKICMRSGVALRTGFEPQPYVTPLGPVKVLILGGSQGARTLNHALPVALAALTNSVQVLHQAGRGNAEQVAALYRQHCPELKVQVLEFIDDMPQALIQSDLVVSRSGASAVSEICAIGRPSVLIPFEFAADNHQLHNALALQGCGAAVCIEGKDVTSESFAASLGQLIGNPEELRKMAQAARNWGRPMAAQAVARDLLQLAGLMRFGAVRPGEIDSPDENQDTQSAARNDKAMPRSAQLLGAI